MYRDITNDASMNRATSTPDRRLHSTVGAPSRRRDRSQLRAFLVAGRNEALEQREDAGEVALLPVLRLLVRRERRVLGVQRRQRRHGALQGGAAPPAQRAQRRGHLLARVVARQRQQRREVVTPADLEQRVQQANAARERGRREAIRTACGGGGR